MTYYIMLRRWHGEATDWGIEPSITTAVGDEFWFEVVTIAVKKRIDIIGLCHLLISETQYA